VKPRVLAGIVLILWLQPTSVLAQFIGGSSFNGTDSVVATWSGKGSAASIGFAALGMSPPKLQNLGGVVQLVLRSSYACRWATGDYRWKVISNTVAEADGLCQVLYYRTFQKDEKPPYRFLWFVTAPYDIRTYVISNVSGVDGASNNSGNGTELAADGVTTTEVGDYLMAFYANLGTGTWTKPTDMGIAVKNDYPYEGRGNLNFRNLATQAWAYPAASTGSKIARVSGPSVPWIADLVAFKPLYSIRPQTLGDIRPGPLYNGCKGKVTLANGVGTFINSCVKSSSFCQCRDTTRIGNSCTTENPLKGRVGLTGTGADVELVNCL
jgi:hypothetical protein